MYCFRMEETVRAMLVYKSRAEQLKQEKQALAAAYEVRYVCCLSVLSQQRYSVIFIQLLWKKVGKKTTNTTVAVI